MSTMDPRNSTFIPIAAAQRYDGRPVVFPDQMKQSAQGNYPDSLLFSLSRSCSHLPSGLAPLPLHAPVSPLKMQDLLDLTDLVDETEYAADDSEFVDDTEWTDAMDLTETCFEDDAVDPHEDLHLAASIFDMLANKADDCMDPLTIEETLRDENISPTTHMSDSSASLLSKKRTRDEREDSPRFRNDQAGQWSQRFRELCEYKQVHGHCHVPHRYSANPALARWVKRQRYQFKLMMDGDRSTMTKDRAMALTMIGFVWDSQNGCWNERYEELKQYRAIHGDCLVPSYYPQQPKLSVWVKCQRRQYKLLCEGQPSHMTSERMRALELLGFQWEVRGGAAKRRKSC